MTNNTPTEKLTLTNAIRNGRLRATEMEIGDSVVGVLKGFKTNNYGTENPILEVNGQEVEMLAAGNLKFLAKDVAVNKRRLGIQTTITRVDDTEKAGHTYTTFKISQAKFAGNANATTTATAGAAGAGASKVALKAQLEAIRGNVKN